MVSVLVSDMMHAVLKNWLIRYIIECFAWIAIVTIVSSVVDWLFQIFGLTVDMYIHMPTDFFPVSGAIFIGWGVYRLLQKLNISNPDFRD